MSLPQQERNNNQITNALVKLYEPYNCIPFLSPVTCPVPLLLTMSEFK